MLPVTNTVVQHRTKRALIRVLFVCPPIVQAAGYTVDWSAIPRAVTPMNRILIAEPSKQPPLKLDLEPPSSQND